jgi:uncharacterized protein (TIGR02145 family)
MHISFLLAAGMATFALWGCGSDPSSVEEINIPDDNQSSSSSKPSSSSQKVSSSSISSSSVSSSSAISSSSTESIKLTDKDFIDIGGQLWTKRNLNINVEGSRCYKDKPANCEEYGRLYTWSMAMNIDTAYDQKEHGKITEPHQGICPDGTHLPSHKEWQELYEYILLNPEVKTYFATQTGGIYDYDDGYKNMNYETVYWSSTEYDATGTGYPFHYAWLWAFRANLSIDFDNSHKTSAVNVRCVKNDTKIDLSTPFVIESSSSSGEFQPDAETIQIGEQVWMTKNLNIPVEGSFCYNEQEAYCEEYGRLYTWSQAMGVDRKFNTEKLGPIDTPYQGICPDGMRLPTDSDWKTLYNTLVNAPEYKDYFMNQMGGVFDYTGKFRSVDEECSFWTSTEYNATGTGFDFEYAWLWAFHKDKALVTDNSHKITGAYIRCIKAE